MSCPNISNASKILLNPCKLLRYLSVSMLIMSLSIDVVKLVEITIDLGNQIKSEYSDEIRAASYKLDYNLIDLDNFFEILIHKKIFDVEQFTNLFI